MLAATFAVLATLPLTFVTQLGIAVALGVLLDTIIVRSVLVTALTLDVGRWMWWPSKLAHRLDEPERRGGAAEDVHAAGSPAREPRRERQPFGRSLPRPSRTLTDTSIGVPSKPHRSRILRSRNRR